ncbi:hypothetical protein ElyMa_003490000 [Elysia marginata]|uniref:PDZ domain-containing protein n=1 Tax=Elysia marginata TaxID=1093978 RepID=A0AAV4EDJ7_9GAST|nr:hypothetical protein ElyMa_003490000 [Elysia marginata]
MDTLKSYFTKILPQGQNPRKGSGKWRRGRTRERGRFVGAIPHRSASTSHVDFDSQDPDMDAISMGSTRTFSPALETFRLQHRASEPYCPTAVTAVNSSHYLLQHQPQFHNHPHHRLQLVNPEGLRTPPPSKPPRRDLIFSVQLDTEGLNDIGVEIDCVPTSANSSPRDRRASFDGGSSGSPSSQSYTRRQHELATADNQGSCSSSSSPSEQRSRGSTSGAVASGASGLTFKVVSLTQGSRCNLDGRVKVHDEIVDINGSALGKETRESASSQGRVGLMRAGISRNTVVKSGNDSTLKWHWYLGNCDLGK